MGEPIMDNRQRAIQLWSLLVLAARTHTVLSYTMVHQMTGLAKLHPDPLGRILYYCVKNELPLLSSLDISQETGQPSFEEVYKHVDIEAEHRRCFVYDWLEKDGQRVPTLEELDEVWNDKEKIKEKYFKDKKAAAVVA